MENEKETLKVEETTPVTQKKKEVKRENLLFNLIFNIVVPVTILAKFTGENYLGPTYGLIIALAFPTLYFIYDLITRKKANIISIIGFVSVFLTGIFGVFKLPTEWIPFKYGAMPLVIAIAVLVSLKTSYPLVRKLLYNDEIIDTDRIAQLLEEKNNTKQFDKTLVNATYMLTASFLLSAVLNFILARMLVVSPSGTTEFNEEVSRMILIHYPVIVLPCTIIMVVALFYLLRSVKKLTGIEKTEELFAEHLRDKMKDKE